MRSIFITLIALSLIGCTSTQSITPQYINPKSYANYDCQTLQSEIARITKLATDTQNEQSSLSLSGVGIGIAGGRHGVYPTISFGVGKSKNDAKKSTLSRLYGEHDAMVLAGREKKCAFVQNIKIYGET